MKRASLTLCLLAAGCATPTRPEVTGETLQLWDNLLYMRPSASGANNCDRKTGERWDAEFARHYESRILAVRTALLSRYAEGVDKERPMVSACVRYPRRPTGRHFGAVLKVLEHRLSLRPARES